MMKKLLLFALFALFGFATGVFFEIHGSTFEDSRLMQVQVNLRDVEKDKVVDLFSGGYDIAAVRPDGDVVVIVSPEEYGRMISEGYSVTVAVPDLRERLVSLYGRSTGLGLLGPYHSYGEMVQELLTIQSDHPGIVLLQVIGTSVEGRDIYAMKVSDNADIDEEEPEVLFTGLHHSREPVSLEICLDLLNVLTDNYGSDPQITALVDERETWVIPMVNPDGYEYAQNIDPYWRKNRRNNGDGTWGVDNNRNYGFKWGWDGIGSSPFGWDETYRGPQPFSEPETQAVRDLTESHDFSISVSHHTFGDMFLYPWGYVYGPTNDQQAYEGIGNALSSIHGYFGGRAPIILYKVNGEFSDWQYGDTGGKSSNLSFTIETGPDFYPAPSSIPQLVQEGQDHNLYLLSIADRPYRFAPPPPQRVDPMPINGDGAFTLTWRSPNQGKRDLAIQFELQEMTGETIVTDDLEAGSSNWILDGFNRSSAKSHSGGWSLYSGSGDLRTSTAMLLTDYKVKVGDLLTFWTWYDIESGWDYAYVEISTDGGKTFETLPGDITTSSNPNGNNEGNGINGSSNGWVKARFDLSGYWAEHIAIRFRYSTDPAVLGSGFYVDDIGLVSVYDSIVTLASDIVDSQYSISGRSDGKYYYRVRGMDESNQWSNWSPVEAVWVVSTPYIGVTLTPDTNEVVPGGRLGFQTFLTNTSPNQESFEAWLDVTMPDGSPLPSNPLMGPIELNLPSGGSVSRHFDFPVPNNAPVGGPWTLHLRSGYHPSGIIAEDSFQFDIVSP